jgi:hypothetical protein
MIFSVVIFVPPQKKYCVATPNYSNQLQKVKPYFQVSFLFVRQSIYAIDFQFFVFFALSRRLSRPAETAPGGGKIEAR